MLVDTMLLVGFIFLLIFGSLFAILAFSAWVIKKFDKDE